MLKCTANSKKTLLKDEIKSMSNVIQVLEQMGSDAKLQSEQNTQAIVQLLATNEIDTEQAEAILNKDITSLERQLDVRPDIVCLIVPADDEQDGDNDENDSTEETSNFAIGF